jgi:hypothetical protein
VITRSKLLKSPEEVGREYAFLVYCGTLVKRKPKAVANAPSQIKAFQQVPGDSRVCTASLAVAVRTCNVSILSYSPLQESETTFPVYYLPWDMNKAIRVTLKPSKHQALAREPDVFFTDNLNGCMVTVEGPPDRPTRLGRSTCRSASIVTASRTRTPAARGMRRSRTTSC